MIVGIRIEFLKTKGKYKPTELVKFTVNSSKICNHWDEF